MKKLMMAMAAVAVAANAALHAATTAFSYQGVLLNEAGTAPLTGNKTVEIRIYNAAENGNALWGRAYNVLLDANGLFSVEVSDSAGTQLSDAGTTTLAALFAAQRASTLYIGLTVPGTSGEIAPRQKLLAVPYATFAADAVAASGDFTVAGRLTAANATVTGTLAAKAVSASGSVGASTLTTSGAATVGGNLTVNGSISGYGTVPVGGIIMWSGAANAIPNGYALCNGQSVNGQTTPDLRGRFIVGAGGSYAVKATGGAEYVTLTVNQMPSHNHAVYGRSSGYTGRHNDDHEVITFANKPWGGWSEYINNTESAGGGQAHENRPPYYALCFIMRVK